MVCLNNLACNGEAEPIAAHTARTRFINTIKSIKDAFLMLFCNTDSRICDRKAYHAAFLCAQGNFNVTMLRCILHCIVDENQNKLTYFLFICVYLCTFGQELFDRNIFLLSKRAHHAYRLSGCCSNIHAYWFELCCPSICARNRKQITHKFCHFFYFITYIFNDLFQKW